MDQRAEWRRRWSAFRETQLNGDAMTDTSAVFEQIQDVIIIRIPGQQLLHVTGESIHAQIPASQNAPKPLNIILDLSNITFLGSIGLTVLVVLLKRVKTAGGHLAVIGLAGQCLDVMRVTRLDKAFEFYADIDQAMNALKTK
jgi:anti-anti-sigma factor